MNQIDPSRLLSVFAASDTTQPPFWRTDALLGALEKLLVHTDKVPGEFANMCRQAFTMVSDPSTKTLIRLGEINGLRRLDDADVVAVNQLFTEVRAEIDALPDDGPRKDRCRSFWRYQARVFLARNGFYAEAAEAETEEATEATTPEARAVSRYLSRVYGLWNTLVTGTDSEQVASFIDSLVLDLRQLQQDVAGTSLDVQWGKGNGPIHVLQALLLTVTPSDIWDELFNGLLEVREQLGASFSTWIQVLEAENEQRMDRVEESVVLASKIVDENTAPDTTAAARLVLARGYDMLTDARTHTVYGLIESAPNAHMIAAIAARELALLNS